MRFTVDEYDQMVASGLLEEDRRCELIEGLLVEKMPKSPLHTFVVKSVAKALAQCTAWGRQAESNDGGEPAESRSLVAIDVRKEDPIRLPKQVSEPEPDIAVVIGPDTRYVLSHPSAADVLMVIEVADSSLVKDRRMAAIYAAAGIPVYVLIDANARVMTRYSQPAADGYKTAETVDAITLEIEGQTLGVVTRDEIFPPTDGASEDSANV